jgi:hypothetical protein
VNPVHAVNFVVVGLYFVNGYLYFVSTKLDFYDFIIWLSNLLTERI